MKIIKKTKVPGTMEVDYTFGGVHRKEVLQGTNETTEDITPALREVYEELRAADNSGVTSKILSAVEVQLERLAKILEVEE